MNKILFIISVILLLAPKLNSQSISTIGEIYDYEIGDEFHYSFIGWTPGYGEGTETNIEILNKYYSLNQDTVFYVQDIKERTTDDPPNWTYNFSIKTIFYTFLDSLINFGVIDSVYSNTNLYFGRKINYYKDEWWSGDTYEYWYTEGCGRVHYEYASNGGLYNAEDDLVYYKKGSEIWGIPNYITVGQREYNEFDFSIYPNPSQDYFNIKTINPINTSIELFSVTGQIIKQMELEMEFTKINIAGLKPGMYILVLKNDGNMFYRKLIKE